MEIKLYGQTVELEEMCDECWGEKTITYKPRNRKRPKTKTCPKCNGIGYVPSENGQVILDFVRKYMSPVDKEQD